MRCVAVASLFGLAQGALPDSQDKASFPWPHAKCSGTADPKGTFPMCYEGAAGALGVKEDVKVKLVSYSDGKGVMNLQGSGIEGIQCNGKNFTKDGATITPDISDCLPKVITVEKVEYCSDQDEITVTVKDSTIPLPVSAQLKKVTCPALGWQSPFPQCTGSGDPKPPFPKCYGGAGGYFGIEENVTIKVSEFSSGMGGAHGKGIWGFTASGRAIINCKGKSFDKNGQLCTTDITDCLPSFVTVPTIAYCSDQDQVFVKVVDSKAGVPYIPVTMTAVACTGDGATVVV